MHMVTKGLCLSNYNRDGEETATVSGSQLINNFTFQQIYKPVRRMIYECIYFNYCVE